MKQIDIKYLECVTGYKCRSDISAYSQKNKIYCLRDEKVKPVNEQMDHLMVSNPRGVTSALPGVRNLWIVEESGIRKIEKEVTNGWCGRCATCCGFDSRTEQLFVRFTNCCFKSGCLVYVYDGKRTYDPGENHIEEIKLLLLGFWAGFETQYGPKPSANSHGCINFGRG
uniref:SFRICE_011649 n=1 Tax=Spodoptera frugiperda TaxID=7108 RepID=A0A2H1V6Z4_SPOFR